MSALPTPLLEVPIDVVLLVYGILILRRGDSTPKAVPEAVPGIATESSAAVYRTR